ncbi:MAG: adenosylcobinamide-GDP ribazoletransferase [Arcobacteraceae bacterium]
MKSIWHGIVLSFSYFSILPVRLKSNASNAKVYTSLLLVFPFVGFAIAFLSVLLFMVLKDYMPMVYCAILCACIYLVLYGFLHLEALSDVIDGYFAFLSGKNAYEIMKEPHVGALGAIGTFVFVLLKVSVIAFLLMESKEEFFLASVIFSRLGLIFGLFAFEFHKNSSFALQLKQVASFTFVAVAFSTYMLFSYFVLDVKMVLLFSFVTLFVVALVLYALKKKFGFLNGDCLGATLEKTEWILLNLGLLI